MKPNLMLAYVSMILGVWVASLLSDPDLPRMKALALSVLAVGLWFMTLPATFIACAEAVQRVLEAERDRDLGRLPLQPLPDAGSERYMLTVADAGEIVLPIDARDLGILSAGLLSGRPFSEREWAQKLHGSFRYIQDQFEARQLVEIVGKRRVLNGRGRRAMLEIYYGHVKSLPPLPLSDGENRMRRVKNARTQARAGV